MDAICCLDLPSMNSSDCLTLYEYVLKCQELSLEKWGTVSRGSLCSFILIIDLKLLKFLNCSLCFSYYVVAFQFFTCYPAFHSYQPHSSSLTCPSLFIPPSIYSHFSVMLFVCSAFVLCALCCSVSFS